MDILNFPANAVAKQQVRESLQTTISGNTHYLFHVLSHVAILQAAPARKGRFKSHQASAFNLPLPSGHDMKRYIDSKEAYVAPHTRITCPCTQNKQGWKIEAKKGEGGSFFWDLAECAILPEDLRRGAKDPAKV